MENVSPDLTPTSVPERIAPEATSPYVITRDSKVTITGGMLLSLAMALVTATGVWLTLRGDVGSAVSGVKHNRAKIKQHTDEEFPAVRERVRDLEESVRAITKGQNDTLKAVQEIRNDVKETLSNRRRRR